MADKKIAFHDPDTGLVVPVKAVDNGDGTFNMGVEATLSTGPITIGEVLLKGGTSGVDADVDAGTKALLVKPTNNANVVVTNTVTVDGSGVTQPVSAASLPLPTGAATAAKQDTAQSTLTGIVNVEGNVNDAAVTGDNTGTLSAKLRGLNKLFADVWDSVNHLLHVDAKQVGTWNVNAATTGVISAANSSQTPLVGDATFQGTEVDTLPYAYIIVSVHADVASAAGGLIFQFSPDTLTWYDTDTYTLAAGLTKTYSLQPFYRYFRVKYINGAVGQAEFDLQTQLKLTPVKPSSMRAGDLASVEDDAELVKAIISGIDPSNQVKDVPTNADGALRVTLENNAGVPVPSASYDDPTFQASYAGSWNGKTAYVFNIMGRRTAWVNTTDYHDIVEFGGSSTIITEMTGAENLEVVSSSASDAAAGTGARTIKICYIDNAGVMQVSAPVTLNGVTPVALGFTALAIQWMEVFTGGTNQVAVGTITLRQVTTLVPFEQITAGGNKSMSGRFMVPVNYQLFIDQWSMEAVAQTMDSRLRATTESFSRATGTRYLFQDNAFLSAGVGSELMVPWLKFDELAKVKVSAIPGSTQQNPRASTSFHAVLIHK